MGCIAFTALAQGLLTERYLDGVPDDSRAARAGSSLSTDQLSDQTLRHVRALAGVAQRRGTSLSQLALAWVLRDPRMTSTLVGASSVEQLDQNLDALRHLDLTPEELEEIDRDAVDAGINLWARSSQA